MFRRKPEPTRLERAEAAAIEAAAALKGGAAALTGHVPPGALDAVTRARIGAAVAAQDARERMAPHAATASVAARERAVAAKEWVAPKVEAGVAGGLAVAAPVVAAATSKAAPAVDAARDKIEEVLPKVVEAVTAAQLAATAVKEQAEERGGGALEVLRGTAVATPVAQGKGRKGRFLLLALLLGALTAGVAAWRRTRPVEDPWAEPGTWAAPSTSVGEGGSDGSALTGGEAASALDAAAGGAASPLSTTAPGTSSSPSTESSAEVPGVPAPATEDAAPDVTEAGVSQPPSALDDAPTPEDLREDLGAPKHLAEGEQPRQDG